MPLNISLKALRANKGLTMDDVAEGLGCTRETYRNKESGKTKLSLDEGFVLANLFDCSITDIWKATKA